MANSKSLSLAKTDVAVVGATPRARAIERPLTGISLSANSSSARYGLWPNSVLSIWLVGATGQGYHLCPLILDIGCSGGRTCNTRTLTGTLERHSTG